MSLVRTPAGTLLMTISDDVDTEITATSSLKGAAPAAILDGLAEARTWAVSVAEEELFAPIRALGRPEFMLSPDASNVDQLLGLFQGLYHEETPEGDRLVDRLPSGCAGAVHGALSSVLDWISYVEYLMRKVSRDGIAEEVPSKVETPLDEVASWIVQLADRKDLDVEKVSLPTVDRVNIPESYR